MARRNKGRTRNGIIAGVLAGVLAPIPYFYLVPVPLGYFWFQTVRYFLAGDLMSGGSPIALAFTSIALLATGILGYYAYQALTKKKTRLGVWLSIATILAPTVVAHGGIFLYAMMRGLVL